MEYTSKDLKQPAWRSMRAAVPSAILVTLVYYLLTSVLPDAVSILTPSVTLDDIMYGRGASIWISLFLTILLALFQMVMEFGYDCWALDVARDRPGGFGRLLDGFGMLGRVLLMNIQIILSSALWCLGIAVIYSILIAIVLVIAEASVSLCYLLVGLMFAAMYITISVILLRYELSTFLLCDYPDDGAGAAVRRSVEMVRGRT
jgi:hypothetical protein